MKLIYIPYYMIDLSLILQIVNFKIKHFLTYLEVLLFFSFLDIFYDLFLILKF